MGDIAKRAFVASAIALALTVAVYAAYTLRVLLAVVFVALVLAAAIRPLALGAQRTLRVGFGVAVLLVYLILGMLVVAGAVVIVPLFLSDLVAFLAVVPSYLGQAGQSISELERLLSSNMPPQQPGSQIPALTGVGLPALAGLVALPLGLITTLAWAVTALALAFYWLLERDAVLWRVGASTSAAHRRQVYQVWIAVERKLGAYVLGQLIVGATIGALTLAGLLALGVRYALLLALFAAFTELIPMIGPFLAAVPAVLIAFFQAPWLGLAVIALYFVIQQIEGNLIYPKVQERVSRVPAFWLLLSLLVGAELMGVLGALIAVPVAVTVSAVVDELLPSAPSDEAIRAAESREEKAA